MMWWSRKGVPELKGNWARVRLALLTSGLLMLGACIPPKVTVNSDQNFRPATIHKIAILPFQTLSTPQRYQSSASQSVLAPTEIRSQFRLPASQLERGQLRSTNSADVPKHAAQQITKMVYEALEHRANVDLVATHEVFNPQVKDGASPSIGNWREKVKQVGTRLEADAVLTGLVRTYRERVGTKIGATPAVVGFEVHLVDPKSGRMLWTGEYYEEQKPMNEDVVGFFERGGAFVTARELAEYGVHKMMKQLPVGGER